MYSESVGGVIYLLIMLTEDLVRKSVKVEERRSSELLRVTESMRLGDVRVSKFQQ